VAVPIAKKIAAKPAVRKKAVARGPRWVRPSGAGVVSGYGMRWGRMHKGIDFGAHYGSPIRAIGDGVVVGAGYLGDEGGYGQITIIRHPGGLYSAYAHQSRMAVHAGEHVKAGEVIGYVGSTGHSTGPHLHFEIRHSAHGGQINPLKWLRAHHAL
jgi:murein DD-endopeptidase MepM/ murein hydrolase activator NlpD